MVTRFDTPSPAYACVNNMRQMDVAMNQWCMEHGKHSGDAVSVDDLTPYIKLNRNGQIPECPAGGRYLITTISNEPRCSLGTNSDARVRTNYIFWIYPKEAGFKHRLP